jgi:hypothetical protein
MAKQTITAAAGKNGSATRNADLSARVLRTLRFALLSAPPAGDQVVTVNVSDLWPFSAARSRMIRSPFTVPALLLASARPSAG